MPRKNKRSSYRKGLRFKPRPESAVGNEEFIDLSQVSSAGGRYKEYERLLDFEEFTPRKGLITRYGKKLLKEGAQYYGRLTIGEIDNGSDTSSSS